jgi:signal transduction histidine kinase
MRISSRRRASVFFLVLGVCLAGVAVAVGSGWIILNWKFDLKVFLGIIFFGAITAGIILNTSFLIREIRRNEQHDSFINAVTHELKTPLASIRLYLQTLQSRDVDPVQRNEFYRLMLADSDRLLNTVEQVLKAGEVGLRKKSLHRVPLDFAGLVRECVDTASTRYHLPAQALRLQMDIQPGEEATVLGDPEELRTVVSNVLDNAVKYSDGKVDVEVRLETLDEKRLKLRVRDQGVGIPVDELKRIFRRFYRARNRLMSKVKGTGLGLFIVRAIVRKHGGDVFAESQGEGHGATIILELPRSVA